MLSAGALCQGSSGAMCLISPCSMRDGVLVVCMVRMAMHGSLRALVVRGHVC